MGRRGMASKLILATALVSLLLSVAVSAERRQFSEEGRRDQKSFRAQQCRLDRIEAVQPVERIESEGGMMELWDENCEQMQCAGVAPRKLTIQPESLHLPHFHPTPSLVYIEQGEGILGMSLPGCPQTYHYTGEGRSSRRQFQEEEEEQEEEDTSGDTYQKLHLFRRGDIIAVPAGIVHWFYNNGNEDMVAICVNDLKNDANQLDQSFRSFFLAGGMPHGRGSRSRQFNFQNILAAFDEELMSESFKVSPDIVRQIQQTEDDRGFIVRATEMQRMMTPPQTQEEEEEMFGRRSTETVRRGFRGSSSRCRGSRCPRSSRSNVAGIDDEITSICNAKFLHNLNARHQAPDMYSPESGTIHTLSHNKLPILSLLDMSAEKVHLTPNSIYTPHWTVTGHTIVYVTRGEAQVQIVGCDGREMMNDRVGEGDMFVAPQFFVSTVRAGSEGFEYVSFKTTSSPMTSPVVGTASVFRAMPVQVITNSYQIPPSDAKEIKMRTGHQQALMSPIRRTRIIA